jgi:hypothetical protein
MIPVGEKDDTDHIFSMWCFISIGGTISKKYHLLPDYSLKTLRFLT